jgi:hypothetical protein
MCITNHDVNKYICGHKVDEPNTEHCDDYVTYGECGNVTNNYPGSTTKRVACASCLQSKKSTKNDKERDENQGGSGDGSEQTAT